MANVKISDQKGKKKGKKRKKLEKKKMKTGKIVTKANLSPMHTWRFHKFFFEPSR